MKQPVANFFRALAFFLLFVPAPLSVVNSTPAVADSVQIVAAEPAVVISEAEEEESEDPWTTRFLAPAAVVIGVVTVGAAVSYYVVNVRGRYRVV